MNNLYKQILDTAENIGLKIVSDEHCCQLLAWLYVYGGGNEEVITNVRLRENILIARNRLNISGGEKINVTLFPILKKYLREYNIKRSPK